MRIVYILVLALVSMEGCSQNPIEKVVYEAASRGFLYKVVVQSAELKLITSFDESDYKTEKCDPNDWKEIQGIVNTINISEIDRMEAPSSNSHRDAAASATITVFKDGKEYTSNNFDHENPPAGLKPLVDKILSMAETVENQ